MKKTIEAIQRVLQADGYYKGNIDGDFGNGSKDALEAAIIAVVTPVSLQPATGLSFIRLVRDKQTPRSTTGEYTAGKLSGFMLECPGPSTAQAMQRKRIPTGTYKLVWHTSAKYPNVVRLYNEQVSQARAILIHVGNYPRDTDGCLLPGKTRGVDLVGASRGALDELIQWIRERGIENVRLVIEERF